MLIRIPLNPSKKNSWTNQFAQGTQKLSLSLKIWNNLCRNVNNFPEPIAQYGLV